MYPSSSRRRAIAIFCLLAGISTVSCIAWAALRMRVSMSAIGSVSILPLLPARLGHAGDDARVGLLAQADAAQAELAVERARPAAAVAAVVVPGGVLARPAGLYAQ